MKASEVGAKIAAHCAGYDMIFMVKFKKDSDVLKIVKGKDENVLSCSLQKGRGQFTRLQSVKFLS